MRRELHSWEKKHKEHFFTIIYFIPDSYPLFGLAKVLNLNNLYAKEKNLFYKEDGKEYKICYSSLFLCYGNEIIGEYDTETVAKKIEIFKEGVTEMAITKSNLPFGTIIIENTKRITPKDKIKELANEVFK
ncbi:MAG: hypothetical protein QXU74_04165 [Candidatus Aenigmatarchaeota archaeon]